jgi:hypothetical protein
MPLILKFDSATSRKTTPRNSGANDSTQCSRSSAPKFRWRHFGQPGKRGARRHAAHVSNHTSHVAHLHGEVAFRRAKRKIATSGVDHYLIHCLLDGRLLSTFGRDTHEVSLGSVIVRDLALNQEGRCV